MTYKKSVALIDKSICFKFSEFKCDGKKYVVSERKVIGSLLYLYDMGEYRETDDRLLRTVDLIITDIRCPKYLFNIFTISVRLTTWFYWIVNKFPYKR